MIAHSTDKKNPDRYDSAFDRQKRTQIGMIARSTDKKNSDWYDSSFNRQKRTQIGMIAHSTDKKRTQISTTAHLTGR